MKIISKNSIIRNGRIKEYTRVIDVVYVVNKHKLKYAGRDVRLEGERWVMKVKHWRPFDRVRVKGRSKSKWRGE